jgi:uncharacterized protein (TIGR02145 family)/uncharacterized repeat protein (TIGR02543 family)
MVLRFCFIFALLVLGCSNPYERDNPIDPYVVHRVTFNANGATGGAPPEVISGSWGDVVTLPEQGGLVREGYVLVSWTDPSGYTYTPGSSYTIRGGSAMSADWLPTYTVTFDGNGATSGAAPPAMTAASNSYIQIPDNGSLQRIGYAFDGWTANISGREIKYNFGSSYSVTGDITLYVKWLPAYTVTFDGNGATSGTAPVAMTVAEGSSIELPANGSLEKTGYAFDGWNTISSGTGTSYRAGSSYIPTGNVTIYAKWLPASTVTFDGNGATSGTVPKAITVADGSSIELPARGDLAKTGYVFGGWNANSSGTGTSYAVSSSYTVTGNVTIYAVWISCNSETHFCDMRDEQLYRITTIGTQVWMAENLNYNATGSKCYNNLDSNCDKYGRLYNWGLASSCNSSYCSSQIKSPHRGICPEGWHLPTDAEWHVLGNDTKKLKATTGWNSNGNGTDDYGFSALPGGGGHSDGRFFNVGGQGYWWSASEYISFTNIIYANYLLMRYEAGSADWLNGEKSDLYSVRCLKD